MGFQPFQPFEMVEIFLSPKFLLSCSFSWRGLHWVFDFIYILSSVFGVPLPIVSKVPWMFSHWGFVHSNGFFLV